MKHKNLRSIFVGLLAIACVSLPVVAGSSVPNPTVYGPIPGVTPGDPSRDYPFFTPMENLADYRYVEEEFFISGFANEYLIPPTGATASIKTSGHPYKTRIVVRRPISPKKFNGVVVLEWQNVTAGYDLDAHWGPSWDHFVRHGYAWVGVSAQRVGVQSKPNGLTEWSPIRYGDLDVTDGGKFMSDQLSYDIFAQAGQAIMHPQGIDPMAGFPIKLVLAVGASQSAARLSIYYNSIQPLHNLFEGYYLLVGGAGLRTDINVKLFQYLSETDLRTGPARRMADSDYFRSWEVAATGHSSYISAVYRDPIVLRDFGAIQWPPDCDKTPYSRTRSYYVINAQYDHLVRWVLYDEAPPIAPKMEVTPGNPPVFARDEFGIVLGGIRLPDVEVPIATNTGINSGATFCILYGSYEPFDDATLRALYPNHGVYVSAVTKVAKDNLKDGYITTEGAMEFRTSAAQSDIGIWK